MINLEPMAAVAAVNMVGNNVDIENMINKSLMVLAEQGVCAFGLFLASRHRAQDIAAAEAIHTALNGLLLSAALVQREDARPNADFYKRITLAQQDEDDIAALQRLLLTKQLLETALTYGRYQAKAVAR